MVKSVIPTDPLQDFQITSDKPITGFVNHLKLNKKLLIYNSDKSSRLGKFFLFFSLKVHWWGPLHFFWLSDLSWWLWQTTNMPKTNLRRLNPPNSFRQKNIVIGTFICVDSIQIHNPIESILKLIFFYIPLFDLFYSQNHLYTSLPCSRPNK